MRILHVIEALDGSEAACEVRQLAPAVAGPGCAVETCCLGAAPAAGEWAGADMPLHALGWKRWLDLSALRELRAHLRQSAFDVVHAWGMTALRVVALTAPEVLPRVIASAPLPARGRPGWWDRRLLRRVRCVVLGGESERRRWAAAGFADVPWQIVPAAAPAVACGAGGLTEYPRRIVCAGPLERGRGFREAIWAADVLHHVFPDLHLFIVGSGRRRPALEALIAGGAMRHVHLLGDQADPASVMASAEVCWVPSRYDCGRHAALTAMAAGRPVVASDVPCLRELVRDNETGCMAPPGDPVGLARRTATLLRDPERASRLGRAASADVAGRFALHAVVRRWRGLYNDLAA